MLDESEEALGDTFTLYDNEIQPSVLLKVTSGEGRRDVEGIEHDVSVLEKYKERDLEMPL